MTVPDVRWRFWWYSSSNVGISTCVQVYAASFYCDKILLFQLERHATSCTNVHVLYWLLFVSLWTKLTYWDRLPLFIFKMFLFFVQNSTFFKKHFRRFCQPKGQKGWINCWLICSYYYFLSTHPFLTDLYLVVNEL